MLDKDREEILRLFNYRCVICYQLANHIHEIIYRSKAHCNPMDIENRVPLCWSCHTLVHRQGALKWENSLRERREIALEVWKKVRLT